MEASTSEHPPNLLLSCLRPLRLPSPPASKTAAFSFLLVQNTLLCLLFLHVLHMPASPFGEKVFSTAVDLQKSGTSITQYMERLGRSTRKDITHVYEGGGGALAGVRVPQRGISGHRPPSTCKNISPVMGTRGGEHFSGGFGPQRGVMRSAALGVVFWGSSVRNGRYRLLLPKPSSCSSWL